MRYLGPRYQRGESGGDQPEINKYIAMLQARMKSTRQSFGAWSGTLSSGRPINIVVPSGGAPVVTLGSVSSTTMKKYLMESGVVLRSMDGGDFYRFYATDSIAANIATPKPLVGYMYLEYNQDSSLNTFFVKPPVLSDDGSFAPMVSMSGDWLVFSERASGLAKLYSQAACGSGIDPLSIFTNLPSDWSQDPYDMAIVRSPIGSGVKWWLLEVTTKIRAVEISVDPQKKGLIQFFINPTAYPAYDRMMLEAWILSTSKPAVGATIYEACSESSFLAATNGRTKCLGWWCWSPQRVGSDKENDAAAVCTFKEVIGAEEYKHIGRLVASFNVGTVSVAASADEDFVSDREGDFDMYLSHYTKVAGTESFVSTEAFAGSKELPSKEIPFYCFFTSSGHEITLTYNTAGDPSDGVYPGIELKAHGYPSGEVLIMSELTHPTYGDTIRVKQSMSKTLLTAQWDDATGNNGVAAIVGPQEVVKDIELGVTAESFTHTYGSVGSTYSGEVVVIMANVDPPDARLVHIPPGVPNAVVDLVLGGETGTDKESIRAGMAGAI